ncbi:hypothetical protein Tco_0690736 [Tanacetum coccineum]
MAAPVISISSDSSNESVGSVMPRVILFGTILTEIPVVPADLPVAPEVRAVAVTSPAGVLELESHSSPETGPSESSLPPVPVAPMVSPFLCLNDSESEPPAVLPERHVSSAAYDAMVGRWRSIDRKEESRATSISSTCYEDSIKEDINAGVPADVETETDVGVGIEVMQLGLVSTEGSLEVMQLGFDVAMQQLHDHMRDILVDRITSIETGQRQLEANSMIVSAERSGLSSRVAVLERSNTRLRETLRMESVRADSFWRRLSFVDDELRLIHRSCYYERMRFRIFETFATRRMGFRP